MESPAKVEKEPILTREELIKGLLNLYQEGNVQAFQKNIDEWLKVTGTAGNSINLEHANILIEAYNLHKDPRLLKLAIAYLVDAARHAYQSHENDLLQEITTQLAELRALEVTKSTEEDPTLVQNPRENGAITGI